MEDNKVVVKGGISFVGVLQIAFIILRLCNVITWNWWLVMLPLIITFGLWLISFIISVIILIITN